VLIEAGDAAAAVSVEVFVSVLVFADLARTTGSGCPSQVAVRPNAVLGPGV
jgi:hypothetical protein